MAQKLSRYAAKVRHGICPSRYGALSAIANPPMRWNQRDGRWEPTEESRRYESEAALRQLGRSDWRKPLVRIVRHQTLIGGEWRLLPLTQEQLRMTR